DIDGGDDRLQRLPIRRFAFSECAIQIDHMQPGGAVAGKSSGHVNGIAVVDCHLVFASLTQADTVTVPEIDGGDYEHVLITPMTSSNNRPFVESALPPRIVLSPRQFVKVPPASATIGARAAQSQRFITGSSMMSARPVATSTCP